MKKMIKTICFFLLLLTATNFGFGQSNQFIYEYRFKSDSLHRDQSDKENMVLQILPHGSRFYSQVKAVYDSVVQVTLKKAVFSRGNHHDFTKLKMANVKSEVVKKYPNYESTLKTSIGNTRLALRNEKKLNWKISNEKDQILGYKVQKATTFWRGRSWIAWFTQEIPLQDGPYEFSGLPGLILRIEDSKADHSFTLVAIRKNSAENKADLFINEKEIEVTEEKFRKFWTDYKKDPVKDLRQIISSPAGNIVATITFDGKTYSNDEMLKASEKRAREEIEKNNNFIELDLYR